MKNYFIAHNTHHTLSFFFFFKLENIVVPNYNKCSKLTLTQKIEEPLSTCVSACSEASTYNVNLNCRLTKGGKFTL